jgi:hypothetical protein
MDRQLTFEIFGRERLFRSTFSDVEEADKFLAKVYKKGPIDSITALQLTDNFSRESQRAYNRSSLFGLY